jgi:hypothetical protein
MITDQRLYRARALEPLTELGGVLFLCDQSGPMTTDDGPFFAVVGAEPFEGLGTHGVFPIWSQGALPAGYGTAPGNVVAPSGMPTGTIAAGAFAEYNNPTPLQQLKKQLMHCRFNLEPLALTGPKEHDLELQVFLPAGAGKYGINAISPGYVNMVNQFPDPASQVDSPAQGANQTTGTVAPAVHPKDDASTREFFLYGLNGPKFRLWNNGSASLSAGTVTLRMWGFRYDLAPLYQDNSWRPTWLYGRVRKAPPYPGQIIVVPTAPYGATSSY